MKPGWIALVFVQVLFLGCSSSTPSFGGAGGSGGGSGPSTGGSGGGDAGNSAAAILGGFLVDMVAAVPASDGTPETPAYTNISGKVYDGQSPPTIVWDATQTSGGCTLYAVRAPFCSPACGSAAACVGTNQCATYPTAQVLGTVVVKGVGVADVTLKDVVANYQAPGDLVLPYPAAAEGAEIQLTATGGKLGAFSLKSVGIAPLDFSGPIPLTSGQPLNLTWTAPGKPDLTRIEVHLDISHHGGTRAKIECDVPDTGTLTIDEPLITKLFALGVAGFPTVSLTRVAAGWTSVASGRISLRVGATLIRPVQIPELLSCTDTTDCPTGKNCQKDLRCQ